MTDTYPFFATTPKHMESLLAREVRELGCPEVTETPGGVSFCAPLTGAYRVCLWSRVANRVLLVLARFPAATPEALYAGVRSIDWPAHLDAGGTFAVDCTVSRSAITHSHFGALKAKDAVVDQFRERLGTRPSVRTVRPDLRINVHVAHDRATVSLDLSGESLHRRGYREHGAAAPLKENLAAAVLLRAGWPDIAAQGGALVDPMCGSGTLLIEAALMASDIAPGLSRDYWGLAGWKRHDADAWCALLREAANRRMQGLARALRIRGYDRDVGAVRAALANVAHAGLGGHVHVEKRSLETCSPARPGDCGLVVVNPPYGERLGGDTDLTALYAQLGELLKARFTGWRAAVFTGNPELCKRLGLRARRMHTLYNGALLCKLLHFEIRPEWFTSDRPQPRPLPPGRGGEGARMFANRLRKNLRHLAKWARREDIHCYRIYDADLPEYALAVDLYEGQERWVHVQEYEAPRDVDARKARTRLREALGAVLEVLQIPEDRLFYKVRRRQRGHEQYTRLAESSHFHEVGEDGLRFLVNFEDYLDTGLFLDHRLTRRLVAKLAAGQRFLNLFGYTGAATVYAAKGGAVSTTTVDMSRTYLEWARRNMALNGLTGEGHTFIQADCLRWLERVQGADRYGLIFLDPPTFSTSKRMAETFDVQRDHADLIQKTARLLTPWGVMIFSTNRRRFELDEEALEGLVAEPLTRATLPKDFERNPRIHHCWKLFRQPSARGG